MKNPNSSTETIKYTLKLLVAGAWAVPWILLAVACAITFVGIPFAFLFWAIGSYPYTRLYKNRALAKYAYAKQGRVMDNDEEVPWET